MQSAVQLSLFHTEQHDLLQSTNMRSIPILSALTNALFLSAVDTSHSYQLYDTIWLRLNGWPEPRSLRELECYQVGQLVSMMLSGFGPMKGTTYDYNVTFDASNVTNIHTDPRRVWPNYNGTNEMSWVQGPCKYRRCAIWPKVRIRNAPEHANNTALPFYENHNVFKWLADKQIMSGNKKTIARKNVERVILKGCAGNYQRSRLRETNDEDIRREVGLYFDQKPPPPPPPPPRSRCEPPKVTCSTQTVQYLGKLTKPKSSPCGLSMMAVIIIALLMSRD
ncbi:hypothetical protein BIW11_08963 [Tropilaelaps mercedesae]|uniref:Uncharacterized protein n=1 Tax=Tropilaelaps mercedesae TaxID=418985 RepID=A0A1V9XM57_9ACAR|nr:hypothetical protein BIW11_08963 [Tropilaelaps mercedesae]